MFAAPLELRLHTACKVLCVHGPPVGSLLVCYATLWLVGGLPVPDEDPVRVTGACKEVLLGRLGGHLLDRPESRQLTVNCVRYTANDFRKVKTCM